MRVWAAAAVCGLVGLVGLAGCGGSSGSPSGGSQQQQNQPPTANAGGPYSGVAGTAISFSATGSSDPQGQALTYAWNFGDSTMGTGATANHAYAAGGSYTVTLAVTDTSGLTGSATVKVTVLAPPVADAGGPYASISGTSIRFSAAGSSDPQGQALTYAWDFGDNSTGTGVSPSHTYASVGGYTASLTVTDTSGLTGTATVVAKSLYVDAALTGTVASGTQPVSGAHVYLLAANTTGYGGAGIAVSPSNASISLLLASLAGGSDSAGGYVTTNSSGAFSMSGYYTCEAGQQLYLYATGAAGAAWMAVLGGCPAASASAIAVTVNEVSTVAAAYAMAGFATDATHVSSSGTALAKLGIANAFLNAANLETLSTGSALATTPAGNGTAPQSKMNTLANALASCATGGAQCAILFADTTADGTSTGEKPEETATAAINIAHNPAANAGALNQLGATGAFAPTYSGVPNEWTLGVTFTGGGIYFPVAIAIDASGNVWVANSSGGGVGNNGSVSKFSSTGLALSPVGTGFTGGGLQFPISIAIDGSGSVWVSNNSVVSSLSKFSSSGGFLSPSTGYSGGGLNGPSSVAIDGFGNAWVANYGGNSLSEFSSTGVALSPSTGYTGGGLNAPRSVAIDGAGNLWTANTNGNNLSKFSSSGAAISPSSGYTGGGLNEPYSIAIDNAGSAWIANWHNAASKFSGAGLAVSPAVGYTGGGLNEPVSAAIDGAGSAWIGDVNSANVAEFSSAGIALSPATGFSGGQSVDPMGVAIDGSGDVWTANNFGGTQSNGSVTELVGAAAPVITPICAGLPTTPTADGSSKLGTRP